MGKKLNLKNKKFGRLTAIKEVGKDKWGKIKWECKCKCGNFCTVKGSALYTGRVKSCGCIRIEKITKHGMAGTTEYIIWEGIIQRCNNPNDTTYKFYGGRGIEVCDRWLKFEDFYKDMGQRPYKMTIERINNNLGYSPDNCKWETRKNQSRNTRVYKTNLLGIKGISWDKKRKKYKARISVDRKDISLGRYFKIEDAINARKEAEKKYWA